MEESSGDSSLSKHSTVKSTEISSSEELGTEDPLPWPTGPCMLPCSLHLSLNGGMTFKRLPFQFTGYRSAPEKLRCSQTQALGLGGGELVLEVVGASENECEEGQDLEENSDLVESSEVKDGEQEADVEDAENWAGPTLKAQDEPNEQNDSNSVEQDAVGSGVEDLANLAEEWLFPVESMCVRLSDGGSFEATVPAEYIPESHHVFFKVPIVERMTAWVSQVKRLRERKREAETAGTPLDEEEVVEPPRPENLHCSIQLSMDGKTFENVGNIVLLAPPCMDRIEPEELQCGGEGKIFGYGFGEAGSRVTVEIDHIISGNDYNVEGIVGEAAEDGTQTVTFLMPSNLNVPPGQHHENYTCTVEVSPNGCSAFTDWRSQCQVAPTPE